MIGRTLASYRILEKLGEGGMGEVYLARDERLGRDVALKLLPEGRLGDAGARSRFRKEAQALLRLSHPHVATLYDFGSADGRDFLVMERVSGPTLDVVLREGVLPEKEVLRLGAELARGLQAAHEAGVVHRDLKPQNLALTQDRLLKVLDFGVAHVAAQNAPEGSEETPTQTAAGEVVGSPPYLSPEQLVGKDADARSDVYSAGACLYELATGKRPHGDKSGALLVDAILHEAPEAPGGVRAGVSAGLEAVITKAMDKDPGLRYQSAKELLVDLERLQQGAAATGTRGARAGRTRGAWRWAVTAAVATTVVGLIALAVLPRPAPRITNARPLGVNLSGDSASWATDGERIYYLSQKDSGRSGLFQVSLKGGESSEITLPFSYALDVFGYLPGESALLLGGSPSLFRLGDPVASAQGPPVWVFPLPAGPARRLGVNAFRAAASPQGDRLALVQRQRIVIARRDGTTLRTLEVGAQIDAVVWNPDGRRVRYNAADSRGDWRTWERNADREEAPQPLWPWSIAGRWTGDGAHYLFSMASFQDRRNDVYVSSRPRWPWSAPHEPVRLTSGPLDYYTVGPIPGGRGLVAFGQTNRGELLRYDVRAQRFQPFLGGLSAYYVEPSPDGAWLAWTSYPDNSLWKGRVDGTERVRLSAPGLLAAFAHWSPDGRQLTFVGGPLNNDRLDLYRIAADGGEPELLVAGPSGRWLWDACWLLDGHSVVFSELSPSNPGLRQVDVGTRVVSSFSGGERLLFPKCSSKGDLLATEFLPSARGVEWLFDASRAAWKRLEPSPLGYPSWTRDGRSFVGINLDTNRIEKRSIATGRLEQVADLRGTPLVALVGSHWMGLAADDSPLVLRDLSTRDIYALDWDVR